MKTLLTILAVLGGLFLIFQLYMVYSTNDVERQPYEVLEKKGELEIRFYPSVQMARVKSNTSSYDTMSSSGFRRLAGFIFGNNKENEKVAMTSPVQVVMGEGEMAMSFMMPSAYTTKDLPTPIDEGIEILNTDEEYVAAISFSGFASDAKLKDYQMKLGELLKENNLTSKGNYRYLGYNPPYQLIGRRNEVVVRVELVK